MKNPLNEGQTQVYTNGRYEPQVGVDVNARYLNTVPSQLLDIVSTLYNSGSKTQMIGGKIVNVGHKSDAQVLAILVGMGTPQQMAVSAITKYKEIIASLTPSNILATYENKQKNTNKMKFTFGNLYEAIKGTLEELNAVNSDNSRISYSVKDSIRILEAYLKELNAVIYESYLSKNSTKEESILNSSPAKDSIEMLENYLKQLKSIAITEEVENSINPVIKFKVARDLHNGLSVHSWIDPVKNLVTYIGELFQKNKYHFKISEAIQRVSTQNDILSEKLRNELTGLLNDSNTSLRENFEKLVKRNPWSRDCNNIINEMKTEESNLIDSKQIKIVKTFSPILENENGIHFHLHGKDYLLKNNKISETYVHESRFRNILEALKLFKQNDDVFSLFGNNEKVLEFNGSTGKIMFGTTDMTNESVYELKNALMVTNFFGYRDQYKVDVVCRLIESLDMLCQMDNFTSLQSQEFAALYLTLINIQESLYINKVNGSMKLNEMIKVESATDAVKITKEFINYDVTPILSKKLVKENNEFAIKQKNINELNDVILFLENKRKDIKNAIIAYGQTTQLSEALSLVESEINKKEVELSKFYTSSLNEKDKKKMK
jgi:hypothetical protein